MTIVKTESFQEQIPANLLGDIPASPQPDVEYLTANGPFELPWMRVEHSNVDKFFTWLLPEESNTVSVGFWYQHIGTLESQSIDINFGGFANEDGDQIAWGIYDNTTPTVQITQESLGATPNKTIEVAEENRYHVNSNWYFIEVKFEKIDTTTGRIIYRINSLELINEIISHPFGEGGIDRFQLNSNQDEITAERYSGYHGLYLDDQGELYGPIAIQTLRPNAQGFHDDWDPSGAFERVNNSPPSSDTIVGADGEEVTHLYPELSRPITFGEIISVSYNVQGETLNADVIPLMRRLRTKTSIISSASGTSVGATNVQAGWAFTAASGKTLEITAVGQLSTTNYVRTVRVWKNSTLVATVEVGANDGFGAFGPYVPLGNPIELTDTDTIVAAIYFDGTTSMRARFEEEQITLRDNIVFIEGRTLSTTDPTLEPTDVDLVRYNGVPTFLFRDTDPAFADRYEGSPIGMQGFTQGMQQAIYHQDPQPGPVGETEWVEEKIDRTEFGMQVIESPTP